jgi:hypothetical protein
MINKGGRINGYLHYKLNQLILRFCIIISSINSYLMSLPGSQHNEERFRDQV